MKNIIIMLCVALMVSACTDQGDSATSAHTGAEAETSAPVLKITQDQLNNAADDGSQWLTYHRTYMAQRYSPNNSINQNNVDQLGLAWYADMDTRRGQEATPLVIDGALYTTTAWSKVKAYNAVTGELLWEFDPKVPKETGVNGCCDVVNRGVAAWQDKLFLGTFDGRLIALDRSSGQVVWETVTVDQSQPYTITGAPLVVDGKVFIGNGGAEFGVRGYMGAYDAENGEQLWRFYTVPDDPANGEQPEYLQQAAETWSGEWWKLGGGGTVWDAMTYDPELDLLYIGVGNGSPWNQSIRSPEGGDNLYLSSIVALRPDTGEYVWHYQTTPGETWDYTASQHIMLADLTLDGEVRKVLMQAPKNGFFYVIDRATGEFISANNFVPVTWAKGIDPETGRPIENPEARYYNSDQVSVVLPGPSGAHSWNPMAYNVEAGLVYIPALIGGFPYLADSNFESKALGFNVGVNFGAIAMPADKAIQQQTMAVTNGALIAWDPVKQEERWRVDYKMPGNGGVLSTAGGLVFQGTIGGELVAYGADSGERLWGFSTQSSVIAAPMTYTIDGEQYVAVMVGRGGIFPLVTGVLAREHGPFRNISRLMVFKLGATGELPPEPALNEVPLNPPTETASQETVDQGTALYGRYCSPCHGDAAVGGGVLPDLRRSGFLLNAAGWKTIVHDGALSERGMVGWQSVMDESEIESIRHYVIRRAHQDKQLMAAP